MRWLRADEVAPWVEHELLSENRDRPVVGLSTQPKTDRTWIEPADLERALGDRADLVGFEDGESTWALADALPPKLEVYGGAVRVWWPGLRVDSNPYDHRLYFVHSVQDAQRVLADLVRAIGGEAPARGFDDPTPRSHPTVLARVTILDGTRVELKAAEFRGELRYTDLPIAALVRCLEVGSEFPAKPVRQRPDGRWEFSTRELLPAAWDLIVDHFREGHVVEVRIAAILKDGLVVELLPGVEGFVYWRYVDHEIRQHELADLVTVGQVVPAKISTLVHDPDPGRRSIKLSMKDAYEAIAGPPRPMPSLIPGGRPFSWPATDLDRRTHDDEPQADQQRGEDPVGDSLDDRLAELEHQLEASDADRRKLREANQDLRKQLRATRDKLAELERRTAHELDPLSSEPAFLLAVRTTYAKMFDEGSRHQDPLQKMRVGSSFLQSIRDLDGIELDKILEVCAQVACGIAHRLDSREVHQLRAGEGGAKSIVRARDKAPAWRCALQVKSPSARRLHWWEIPGEDGRTIEFAKVGVHDDMSIPE